MIDTAKFHYQDPHWCDEPIHQTNNKFADFLMPKSAVTGKRQFNFMPLKVEKFLGECAFGLSAMNFQKSSAGPRSSDRSYQEIADAILADLKRQAPKCKGQSWNFEVTVIDSNELNAFAYPGGHIVITEKMMKEIHNFCQFGKAFEVKTKANGSHPSARMTVFSAQPEDVIAAVIGHEMTHICARHTSVALTISCIASALLLILSLIWSGVNHYLKAMAQKGADENVKVDDVSHGQMQKEKEFMSSSVSPDQTKFDVKAAGDLMEVTGKLLLSCRQLFDRAQQLGQLWSSRRCEFECDKYGMIYAARAGYKPEGAVALQKMLCDKDLMPAIRRLMEWMSTHPTGEHRIDQLVYELMDRSTRTFKDLANSAQRPSMPTALPIDLSDECQMPAAAV